MTSQGYVTWNLFHKFEDHQKKHKRNKIYVYTLHIYLIHYMHVYFTFVLICLSNFQVGIYMTDILSNFDLHINKRPLRTWKVHFIVRRFVFQFCRWASEPHNHQRGANGTTGATEGAAFKKWRTKKKLTDKTIEKTH